MVAMRDAVARTLLVGLGGFLGASARYWFGGFVQARTSGTFPWGTVVVNLTGAFLLGLLMAALTGRFATPRAPQIRLLLAVGVLGGYTTFSSLTHETLTLMTGAAWLKAFGNAVGSLAAGMVAVWIGDRLGRIL
jgi:CrcB protein